MRSNTLTRVSNNPGAVHRPVEQTNELRILCANLGSLFRSL